MIVYALTIFASAFLLFLVQPIIAKQILPWFGGSAAVWTTCLVFFQFVLLFGYAYSDWTTRHMRPRRQIGLHLALLAVSLLSLPILADPAWKPGGEEEPTWRILGLLLATIGLPYFLLATTGPLVQAWFARSFPAGTVYRLFALSNLGSLLALVSYPFLLEPWITTLQQAVGWSAGYGLFVALCAAAALYSTRTALNAATRAGADSMEPPSRDEPRPTRTALAMWLVYSAMGSFMLMAVTNHITHDVASIPFLWILPLTIYLVTFILCFEGHRVYQRGLFLAALLVGVPIMAWALHAEISTGNIAQSVLVFSLGLFICCMFFHGELANMKPAPRYLTLFYLMVSLGGALGGLFVAFGAPRVFSTYYEFSAGLIMTLALAWFVARNVHRALSFVVIGAVLFSGYHVYKYVTDLSHDTVVMTRNFYGTLRVRDYGSGESATRDFWHGVIIHGEQYRSERRRMEPTTYYGVTSGIGRTLAALGPERARVGIVGLGAGTLATYGRPGDVYRFYELNPQVLEIARSQFSFLSGSRARIEHALGDARLTMESESAQGYDVIAVDAFSSDSVPVHLLTREAMAVYLGHLKPGGVIAFHVTNRFVNLAPVVQRLAAERDLHAVLVADGALKSELYASEWVLVSRNEKLLTSPAIAGAAAPIVPIPSLATWTDDYNNLFRILK